ncbi:MAG: hypothetical protein M1825_005498 [Sarcosagium campestre]|nr:MAG: hypothetical protein M1825_005498 [Sarcosagium campestre]
MRDKVIPMAGIGISQRFESDEEKLVQSPSDFDKLNHSMGTQGVAMKQLPRADSGKDAWLFLAGCFCIEALVWGFPLSYGIFKDYYANHEPFAAAKPGTAIVGTMSTGLIYLGAPLNFALLQAFPQIRRISSVVGLIITVVALVASSFATEVWHLILTQGMLYAVGTSLLYTPVILYLDEWFVRRKGFAFGVMWAGTGTGGLVVPFLMNWGLQVYGHRTMLRGWAIVLLVSCAPLLYYVKPRLPISSDPASRKIKLGFLRNPTFWLLQTGNVFQGLGYFIPAIFLPSFARSLSLSHLSASLTVSLLNASSVVGQIALGALTDRLHVTSVILISTLGSCLAVLLLWGLAHSMPLLCVFALAYGLFAGGFCATWTGVIREVQRREPKSEMGMMLGCLAAGRGIGNVLCGPISEALVRQGAWAGTKGVVGAYGTAYGGLIVFTGVAVLMGGFGYSARWMPETVRVEKSNWTRRIGDIT